MCLFALPENADHVLSITLQRVIPEKDTAQYMLEFKILSYTTTIVLSATYQRDSIKDDIRSTWRFYYCFSKSNRFLLLMRRL